MATAADLNDCLSAFFETVGLLGENNDLGERVYRKRARYHRSLAKVVQAERLREGFDFIINIERTNNPEGGKDSNC